MRVDIHTCSPTRIRTDPHTDALTTGTHTDTLT